MIRPTDKIDYKGILETIYNELKNEQTDGKVPGYIPELGLVDSGKFGISLTTMSGEHFEFGDSAEKFSIQSVSKVLSLSMAMCCSREALWKRVGVEPSGSAFNSIIQLEYEKGVPRNPFINAGAIVVADVLLSSLKYPKEDFLTYVQDLCGSLEIKYNLTVAASEQSVGYMNSALAYMIKAKGNLENEVEDVLDFYYHQCSLEMDCNELVQSFFNLGETNRPFGSGEYILSSSQARRINALMMTCGFYDESGEFAFEVGLPGKSGVGGAIVAINPLEYCVSVWSPPLNKKGNSSKGMKALEMLTTLTGGSVF